MATEVTGVLLETAVTGDNQTNVTATSLEVAVTGANQTNVAATSLEVAVTGANQTNVANAFLEVAVTDSPFIGCLQKSYLLDVQSHAMPTDKYRPLTGVYADEESIPGWTWDRRVLEHANTPATQYRTFLGGQAVGLRDGTTHALWQSGFVSNLEYVDLAHYRTAEFLTWTPRVRAGAYALHHDVHTLFSDHSYSENVDTANNANGVNVVTLRSDCLEQTISAALYRRDENFLIFKYYDFQYVEVFTGEIDTGTATRLSTGVADGVITYANLAGRKQEFTIRGTNIEFNGNWQIDVGIFVASAGHSVALPCTLDELCEPFGKGSSTGRLLFTEFFPIQSGSAELITRNTAGTITTAWTEVTTLDFSLPTDQHYVVDHDLGIVTMGGFQAPDLTLLVDINAVVTSLEVYVDDVAMAQYHEQGVLVIGTEEIKYESKTRNGFGTLTRGYNTTTAAVHTAGDVVSDRKHGAGTTEQVFLCYTAIPRIDYEVSTYDLRSANKGSWLDVRPSVNVETNNILQLLSSQVNLAEVTLVTDSESLGGNLYGPVYYGTDVSRMTATGFDANGNVVDGLDLTIKVLSGGGYLNGSFTQVSDLSNTLGQIHAFYNSPYTRSSMESAVSLVAHVGPDTEMTLSDFDGDATPSDIWVFQILKHDDIVGTTGLERQIITTTSALPPYGLAKFTIDGVIGEEYEGGIAVILGTDAIKYTVGITKVFQTLDVSSEPISEVYIDTLIAGAIADAQPVWLSRKDAIAWDPAQLNGTRYILYEWEAVNAIHPITGVAGAWLPLHPDSIVDNVLTFDARNLPIPLPNDDTFDLGGYIVIAPRIVELQAFGIDPVSGRIILSNRIRLQLQLPNFLTGVDASGALPIPYGWTLVTSSFNIGAGVGGANFITINPAADDINQFSLLGTM